jgi:hypothetical protein
VGFDGVDEMHGVRLGEMLDTKIVNTENNCSAFGAVAPEAWVQGHGLVAGWC